MKKGNIFIVTAPSGAGKTTLVTALLAADAHIELSISYTTRAPRGGETNGREYHFVTEETFLAMQAQGDFLEWAQVYGNYYGTSKSWIEQRLASGVDILLEIDVQGARQVRELFPQALSVFILPPSARVLEARLRGRASDAPEQIARRLAAAKEEMQHVNEFDYWVINHQVDEAVRDITSIVRAARLTQHRMMAAYGQEIAQQLETL